LPAMRNPLLVISGETLFVFFGWAKRGEVWPGGECVNVGLRVRGQLPTEFICLAHCGPH